MVADDKRHDELAPDAEWAKASALAEAVAGIAEANPDGLRGEELFTFERVAGLGVTATEPLAVFESDEAGKRLVVSHIFASGLIAAAAEAMIVAAHRDADGDHDEAEEQAISPSSAAGMRGAAECPPNSTGGTAKTSRSRP